LPSWTFIADEEQSAPSFKAAKDRLMLLLGAVVPGTSELKPMLVYHSQTQRAVKGLNKPMLPFYYKWNRRAWMTQEICLDWYTNYFCPSIFVKRMSYQPRRLFFLTLLLAILQTLLNSEPWGHQCCLHATKHHISFAINGPGDNSNL
jgi:hypothetical protein